MPLIGLATATVAAMLLFARIDRTSNRVAVAAMWAVLAAFSFGVRI